MDADRLQEAVDALDAWFESWKKDDADAALASLSDNVLGIGTDAGEFWIGRSSLEEAVKRQCQAARTLKVDVRARHVEIHSSAEVAWFTAVEDVTFEASGRQVAVNGMRTSGVMEKRDGRWLIVQFHHSVGPQQQVLAY